MPDMDAKTKTALEALKFTCPLTEAKSVWPCMSDGCGHWHALDIPNQHKGYCYTIRKNEKERSNGR